MIETNPEKHLSKSQRSGCWRCGAPVFGLQELSRLIGGYHARLCGECLNDWEIFANENPFCLERMAVDDEYNAAFAMASGSGTDCTNLLKAITARRLAIERQLFAVAETWTDDVIERPAPPPPPPLTEQELTEMRERRERRLRLQLEIIEKEREARDT